MPNKVQPLAREGGQGKEEQSSGVSGCNGGRKEMRKFGIQPCVCVREGASVRTELFFQLSRWIETCFVFNPFYGHLLTIELPVFIKTISSVDLVLLKC